MIPAGYMAKHVQARPAGFDAPSVDDIYSVSACLSNNFSDYINLWRHNGYWLFDSPLVIQAVAEETGIPLTGSTLFYYEVHPFEFHEHEIEKRWLPFEPEPSFPLNVTVPADAQLAGYDVVTVSGRAAPECSPLSCSGLAKEIETNRHCLLSSLEEAKNLLESGRFDNSEPGPFRVLAVYTTPWPKPAP